MPEDLKEDEEGKITDVPSNTMGLCNFVLIAVRANYVLTAIVNVTDGIKNGAECIIEKIDYKHPIRQVLANKAQPARDLSAILISLFRRFMAFEGSDDSSKLIKIKN